MPFLIFNLGILDGKLNPFSTITKPPNSRLNSIQNLLNEGFVICTLSLSASFLDALTPAVAQIVPDGSLGNEASVVVPNVEINGIPSERIDGGAIRGANLFHSFGEFNIPEARGAYFSNPNGIINILTRVTGTNRSNIFDTLGVLGNANLFLINPNGIIFGPNARLDLRGSFLAASASGIAFDGFEFSTVNPQAPPLLTVNIPIGLRFRENPGNIVVTGPGHNLGIDPQTGTFDYRNRPVGLQVDTNQTLALVGGEVVLTGGNLTASGGRIELGSLAGSGLVNLTPFDRGWALDYTGVSNFGDIRLAPVASVTTRGESGGAIGVQGRRVAIANSSIIDSSTLGAGSGGNLTIRATEAIELSGSIPGTPISSFMLAQVQPGATGTGGDITIETQLLRLTDGGQISAVTFGRGNGGDLNVIATEVELRGTSANGQAPSGLFTSVSPTGIGRGGNLTVNTQRLLAEGGAQILTTTLGQGDAGSLTVQAQTIELVGTAANGQIRSGLFADVGSTGVGNGGNLRLETQSLLLADGARVGAGIFGRGNGGDLNVIATEVELRGTSANGQLPSGLFTSVSPIGIGRAGNLTVNTQRLLVTGGAAIFSSTGGQGNAGTLTVLAETVELSGSSANGRIPSALSTGVAPTGIGDGNALLIETQRLRVTDGARIVSGTSGRGNSGNLTIRAEDIEVRGTRANGLFSSGLFSTVEATGIGKGGILTIETNRLQVTDGAKVEVSTIGQGDAGNLIVRATESIELSGATDGARFASGLYGTVIALPEFGIQGRGKGGTLSITTPRLQIENGARIAVSDQSGVEGAGDMTIDADTIRLNNGAIIEANTLGQINGSITLNARDIQLRRNSRIITNAGANATGGNININSDILLAFRGENSDITANAQGGRGGRIEINVPNIFGISALTREQLAALLPPESILDPTQLFSSDITAISQAGSQLSGQVIFSTSGINPAQGLVELPQNVVDSAALIAANPCVTGATSQFIVTGRGGLPASPANSLSDDSVRVSWSDLPQEQQGRSIVGAGFTNNLTTRTDNLTKPALTPAQGWAIDDKGEVTLVGYNPGDAASSRHPHPQTICPPR
ncbi:MAG TPA: hypothetical protein DDW76_19575 [Cyanobacteria bacterium UBA11369]|nr:hypothetical protein [Cyanobacteria bacterium UBA11371]HBE31553.1 hypothetical protein [Cyanobacteria bacterium UBA11368]HBE50908.1 hypothetical protein [Cyanobacteria bacterium UBA11369]